MIECNDNTLKQEIDIIELQRSYFVTLVSHRTVNHSYYRSIKEIILFCLNTKIHAFGISYIKTQQSHSVL